MNRSLKITASLSRSVLAGLLFAGLAVAGQTPPEDGAAQTAPGPAANLTGAGATFPAPLYQRWIDEYRAVRPELGIRYEAVGSGEGIKRFLAGTVDFGASDAAMSDADLKRVDPRRGALMVPMTAGMVVLAYNIPGVGEGLVLPREVYRGIFSGAVEYWDDPRIQAANRGLVLPHKRIQTVVRRDSSGTTYLFTRHLAAIDPGWTQGGPGVGKVVDWPGGAMSVPGNEGVAQRVKLTEGSIGYMQYEFAKRLGLPIASLENRAGQAPAPGPDSGRAALASAGELPADLRLFVPDPAGTDAYPIVGYSWVLLDRHYVEVAKSQALKAFFAWGLGDGQRTAVELGYVPLPEEIVAKAREALAAVQ